MASTLQTGREQFVSTSLTTRPRTNSFRRINWRKLSSSARSVLCIHRTSRMQQDGNDWTRDSDILHMRSRSDVPHTSSDGSMAPQKSKPRKLQRARTEVVGGNASAKEAAKALTIRSTAFTPPIEAAASLNLNPLSIKERGAQLRRGDASPLCDLDRSVPLHFEEAIAEYQVSPDGDTIEAVIDAMFQLGDRSGASTPGPLTPRNDDAELEKLEEKEERIVQIASVEQREKRISVGAHWGATEEDARRAWEAMKRRLIHIEEHGALPDDSEHVAPSWNYRDGVDRALRESRARWRKGWAEEAIRRSQAGQELGQVPQAREEQKDARSKEKEDSDEEDEEMDMNMDMDMTTTRTKKGRRHAGCWIREEDGVFVRLYAHRT